MEHSIEKLAELFLQFPGIGRRQAKRFVYALLRKDQRYLNELSSAISHIKGRVNQCQSCYRFYEAADPRERICRLCQQGDPEYILVVEKDSDLERVQSTGIYSGKYFVLGGFISSHEQKKSYARSNELLEQIQLRTDNGSLREVIYGLSVSPEAEHTRLRLTQMIKQQHPQLQQSTLGRGLSTGTELEYSDTQTLEHAFGSRIKEA